MCQEIYIDTKSHSTVLCIQSEIAAASSVCLRHYIMMVYCSGGGVAGYLSEPGNV